MIKHLFAALRELWISKPLAYAMIVTLGSIILAHLVVIYMYGSVVVYEESRAVCVVEIIMLTGILLWGLERLGILKRVKSLLTVGVLLLVLLVTALPAPVYAAGWVSPTGHSDPGGDWYNEVQTYNDDIEDFGYDANVQDETWSDYIELSHSAIECNKVRYYASNIDGDVNIWVKYDGGETWYDIHEDTATEMEYVEVSLGGTYSVVRARVRFMPHEGLRHVELRDFDFWEVAPPTVVTLAATNVEETTATLNGNMTYSDEDVVEVGFDWGLTDSYGYSWTETESAPYTGAFSHGITSLESDTTYHFRAKARSSEGWGYGSDLTFTTKACCTVTTDSVTSTSQTGTTLVGSITAVGDSTITRIALDWGLTVAYGNSWITDSGAPYGADSYTHAISGLSSSTTYHYRFRAEDDCGWNNGSDATFRTHGAPIVVTDYATVVSDEGAILYGTLTLFGDGTTSANVWFRYGTAVGNYPYSTTPKTVTALEQFSITASGLNAGVRYYFTAVAQNTLDTDYGSVEAFVIEAAVADSCNYYTEIHTSSTSSYSYLGLVVDFNHTYMASSGYMTSAALGLDTLMAESGLPILHTPSSTKLSYMLDSLSGNGTVTTVYYLGATPLLSDLDFVVGYGGNAATSSDLELGDTFTVDVSGTVNTSLTNKDVVRRADAFYIRVNDGNVTVIVGTIASPSASVTAEVASGTHRITATSDGTTLELYIDGTLLGDDAAASVPPSSNDWYFLLDNSMPSMEYLGIEIDEDWVLWYQPMELITSDTLVDLVGSYDADISWGSKPSDVTITIENLVPCEVTTVIPQEEEILPEIVQPDFDAGSDFSNLPFYEFFHEMLPLGGVPEKVFWSGAIFVIAMTLGLISIIYIKSVAVMLGVMGAVFVAGVMTDPPILPYWVPLVYGLLAVVYLIRRQASPI